MTTRDTPAQTDLVIFDLDGTITRRDTLWGYVLGFALRQPRRLLRLVAVVPALFAFALGRADHGQLKSALIRSVMRDTPRSELDNWTRQYIPQLLRTGVFFNALRQIEHHRAAGDHLVLMTATVDLYVPELAQALGFDEWICTGVTWAEDRLEGRLSGPNVRDEEKARHLRELKNRFPGRSVVAYGNSAPDLPHLRLADRAVLINAGASLRRMATEPQIEFRHWQ